MDPVDGPQLRGCVGEMGFRGPLGDAKRVAGLLRGLPARDQREESTGRRQPGWQCVASSGGGGSGSNELQQRQYAPGGDRFSKQVALSFRTPVCLEACELFGIFNAFGGRR
jgi:hypothetical protein